MSVKYELVKSYYDEGLWTELQVRNAVVKNWIDKDEFELIIDKMY